MALVLTVANNLKAESDVVRIVTPTGDVIEILAQINRKTLRVSIEAPRACIIDRIKPEKPTHDNNRYSASQQNKARKRMASLVQAVAENNHE